MQAESAVAESKASVKEVTRSTFHVTRFWLNAEALENAEFMLETDATFQPPMFWLNAVALENAEFMLDTDATFHLPMSALNVGLLLKRSAIDVTAAVFQPTMLPYVVASPLIHAVTAAPILPSVMHTAQVTEPTVHARLNVGQMPWNVEPHAL